VAYFKEVYTDWGRGTPGDNTESNRVFNLWHHEYERGSLSISLRSMKS